jgi:oligopeptide transport system substrate-binding protein
MYTHPFPSVVRLVIVSFLLLCMVVLIPAAHATMSQARPVTLYRVADQDYEELITELDPPLSNSPDAMESLFLGLTNVDPVTGSIGPELAVGWRVSEDGRVWTFTLRDDVPWVRWDPAAGEASILRTVTAHDVVYSIQRACDPRTGALYVDLISSLIAGCNTLAARPVNQVTEEDYGLVATQALDDTTLEIQLQHAAGYFLNLTQTMILKAVPRENIEQHGEDWTQPGIIVTNGPFVLDEWRNGRGWVLVRNPHLPADLRGPGNVERVVLTIFDDRLNAFQAYLDNQADWGHVPSARRPDIVADPAFASELVPQYSIASFYYAFANDKAPFDNVHVRRAFSAALDRDWWVREFRPADGISMIHFTPPGVFGAPPLDEVGVGYNPDYAREQLALAGYPECEGFPEIIGLTWADAGEVMVFLAARLEEVLGCDPDLIRVEEMPFDQMYSRINPDSPAEYRPHLWIGGWGADYPDAHSFLGDFLYCESANNFKRPCSEIDDLIDQAAVETDPLVRIGLYRDIEERLFGPEGEFPIIPVHTLIDYYVVKPWVTGPINTDGQFSGLHYDWYTIDQAAQLAARAK